MVRVRQEVAVLHMSKEGCFDSSVVVPVIANIRRDDDDDDDDDDKPVWPTWAVGALFS